MPYRYRAHTAQVGAFGRPQTPDTICLHWIRQQRVLTRTDLLQLTGFSQPTVTRAVTRLLDAGWVKQRPDLSRPDGRRGRPQTPIELAGATAMFAGIAVGTTSTFLGLYDISGRMLTRTTLNTHVARQGEGTFLDRVVAALEDLAAPHLPTLRGLGMTTSGQVTPDGMTTAPNLGWRRVNLVKLLRERVDVPVTVSAAVSAILGSEMQAAELPPKGTHAPALLALFADDSISAAITTDTDVEQISPLPPLRDGFPPENTLTTTALLRAARAHHRRIFRLADAVEQAEREPAIRELLDARVDSLADVTARIVAERRPGTVVLAGSAFTADKSAPRRFADAFRAASTVSRVNLRLIPTHREIVPAIARAVALSGVLRSPLDFPVK